MSDVNQEMRATADYAVKSALERYGLVLDYSEESLSILDNILEKIYWGLSSHEDDDGENGLVYNTAIIWGSYLGEYMCQKWGGTWTIKGTDRRVSITSIEFSPIGFVYQKITNHPEYKVENFVNETKRVIYTSVIHPKKTQVVAESVGQPDKKTTHKPAIKSIAINKRVLMIGAGILAVFIVFAACTTGYSLIRSGGLPALGVFGNFDSTTTNTPTPINSVTATIAITNTPLSTATPLPTYTPSPSETPLPTNTPVPTDTPSPSPTPTETEVPIPTRTRTPRPTSTPTEEPPTPVPPTDTPVPPTLPPPDSIESCGVSPSSIPAGTNVDLTFEVTFSASGYGFTVLSFSPGFPGQSGCDGSGQVASCVGSSGLLPGYTEVNVTLRTPLGDCSVKYTSQ